MASGPNLIKPFFENDSNYDIISQSVSTPESIQLGWLPEQCTAYEENGFTIVNYDRKKFRSTGPTLC